MDGWITELLNVNNWFFLCKIMKFRWNIGNKCKRSNRWKTQHPMKTRLDLHRMWLGGNNWAETENKERRERKLKKNKHVRKQLVKEVTKIQTIDSNKKTAEKYKHNRIQQIYGKLQHKDTEWVLDTPAFLLLPFVCIYTNNYWHMNGCENDVNLFQITPKGKAAGWMCALHCRYEYTVGRHAGFMS